MLRLHHWLHAINVVTQSISHNLVIEKSSTQIQNKKYVKTQI